MGDFFQRRGKAGRSRLINEEDNQDSETGPGQHSVSYGATTRIRGMQSMLFTFVHLPVLRHTRSGVSEDQW